MRKCRERIAGGVWRCAGDTGGREVTVTRPQMRVARASGLRARRGWGEREPSGRPLRGKTGDRIRTRPSPRPTIPRGDRIAEEVHGGAGGAGEWVVREPRVPRDPATRVSEANDAKGGEGAASARPRTRDRTRSQRQGTSAIRTKKPGHPRGAGSARAVGRTGQRAGRPGPDGVNQLHPVVSPQFSHLWQVPLRTVSQPQRGQGGASGVELSRR